MKKIKLSGFLDFIFGTSFIFLICFVWARYFLHNQILSILLCCVITFCVVALFYFIRRKKQLKTQTSKNDLTSAHDIASHFLLCTKQETLKEFAKIFGTKKDIKIKSDLIIIEKVAIRPIYNRYEITDKDILQSYAKIKNTNIDKIVICCLSASAKAKDIANIINNKKIIILNELDAYKNIFKPLNFKVEPVKKTKKTTFKQKLLNYGQIALTKQRTKSYLTISLILLFSSFIMRYNIYYLVFSTIATILALYSYFNTKFNTKKTEQVFL